MINLDDALLGELKNLLETAGTNGGAMSASVYDTAQALRLAPPKDGGRDVVAWLLAQQQPDGGWNDPELPLFRDGPTLAAIMALQGRSDVPRAREAVKEGEAFLRHDKGAWNEPWPKARPAGVEISLPALLDEARSLGLDVPSLEAYPAFGERGPRMRAMLPLLQKTLPAVAYFTWDSWGRDPARELIHPEAGIAINPANVARWLSMTAAEPDLAAPRDAAHSFLARASAVTDERMTGVYPTSWPMPLFEIAFCLYALLITDLLDHPALRDVVQRQLDKLAAAMKPEGLGCSPWFDVDGDDTAAAIAVLRAAGRPVDAAPLRGFQSRDHFCTWLHKVQPSASVTGRAVHALRLLGEDTRPMQGYLVRTQNEAGVWDGDPWNVSWAYVTYHAITALEPLGPTPALEGAIRALLDRQHPDGGYGLGPTSNPFETLWGTLALLACRSAGLLHDELSRALGRAQAWMLDQDRAHRRDMPLRWIAKDLYAPRRIDRAFELATLLTLRKAL
ncbi:prenyltransferase/squalene oxidase repeat-containing protein [Polyangium aurulentum]|uniref:prenyltransferase/squalene oxidase repeat-containing protein n=1 Tax=Polyangium aurulentum TaxID=2567896 RepID=UPI0010AE6CE8|nr:prenyltransferase/squalene oxidase repeat-containing protein [Polyangium aurulentum]UQA56249.1 hypothetical protein E8A73_033770 [Polyangium aurulentum]